MKRSVIYPVHSLIKIVLDTITEHGLIEPDDAVFVAFSGGADSVFLLHSLLVLRTLLGYRSITALHLHHGLRGEEADRDERFVRDICTKWKVPLIVKNTDVKKEASLCHESVEEAGRRLRYEFFENAMTNEHSAKLATAHHADDHAETILMNMFRGCGIKGVAGIPLQRENIVRPLLRCRSQDIRKYCCENALVFVEDSTNRSLDYTRNRVRFGIMSSVEEVYPQAIESMLRLSETAREDDECLERLAKDAMRDAVTSFDNVYRAEALNAYPDAIVKRVLIHAAQKIGAVSLTFLQINEMLNVLKNGGCCNLCGGMTVRCDRERICFVGCEYTSKPKTQVISIGVPFEFGEKTYVAERIGREEYDALRFVNKNLFNFCVTYDIINGDIVMRSRCDGDSFRPYNRHCTKRLKKWFNENKIPSFLRDTQAVLCDDNGILCLPGLAVDERAAVVEHTQQILVIKTLHKKDCE